jgi:hypothetical protein
LKAISWFAFAMQSRQKGAREIIGPPKAGSPSIWVAHIAAGAIVVSCR